MEEWLMVCDEHGNDLYTEKRSIIHQKGLWHKVVHLWMFDDTSLYFQQRSEQKKEYPLAYDITCAGHIDPQETPKEALFRECREELGIHLQYHQIKEIGTFVEAMNHPHSTDREIAYVYLCRFPEQHLILNEEVKTIGSIRLSELEALLKQEISSVCFHDVFQDTKSGISNETLLIHEPSYYEWILLKLREIHL